MARGATGSPPGRGIEGDRMAGVRRVPFADVDAELRASQDVTRGPGRWTVEMIREADRAAGGNWWALRVPGVALLDVGLPRHAGEPCQGDALELIPTGGTTVAGAVRALARQLDAYRAANRSCAGRIDRARGEPFSRILLSRRPLARPEYAGMGPAPAYHLDGLHRLIGWGAEGRLTAEAWIDVYLAGVLDERGGGLPWP
jgi:hypothetical protein